MGINFGDIFDKRKKAYLIMKKISGGQYTKVPILLDSYSGS